MSTYLLSLHILLLLVVLILLPEKAMAESSTPNLILSEVQIAGDETVDEFIEIYNLGGTATSLKNYKVVRRTKTGTSNSSIRSSFTEDDVVPARGFYLLTNKSALINIANLKDAEFISSATLTADNSLALLDKDSLIVDAVAWGTGHTAPLSSETPEPNPPKNNSLVRDRETLLWTLTDKTTPTNSHGESLPVQAPEELPADPPPAPEPTITTVRLSEILPNPKEKGEQNEFIELYNTGEEALSLGGWSIKDASKTGKYTFPDSTVIEGMGFLVILRTVSKLSLNNSNETLTLFDNQGNEVGTVRYEKTKEDVSLNYGKEKWRGGKPTPGKPNEINNLPEITERVPKKGYRDIAVSFNATGKDIDGDTLKYTWDFGDDHKSYKAKTSHTYKEKGSYHVTLTISDGNEDTIETFSIKIESFPTPDVRITALLPNPSGADSENEWIAIENRGKKQVNLKGFGIATGWKKLINHPIREDFILDPKEERRLTRAYSLFTLPNQKGKIELRAPNKKVLQKIKYKLEKSVAEDIVYRKEKGKRWEWEEDKTAKEEDFLSREESPLIEEVPLEEPLPDTEKETDEKVLGAETQKEASRQSDYLTLLNYGTNITLPEDIVLTFSENFPDDANVSPDSVDYSPSGTFLQKVNGYLNDLQNRG